MRRVRQQAAATRSTPKDAADFDTLVAELDELILSHESATSSCSRDGEERSPLLIEVAELATAGLERFPRNGELLRRRAYALCRLSPGDDECVGDSRDDLQEALQFEPTNLRLALDLMGELFAFDGVGDQEVADVAGAARPARSACSADPGDRKSVV